MGGITRLYKGLLVALSIPILYAGFFSKETGGEYGIGLVDKLILFMKMLANQRRMAGASNFLEHMFMATVIMRIPRDLRGSIVECGTYKGASAANLSLVSRLCGRQLEIFDSFQGLPEPSGQDASHALIGYSEIHSYQRGAFRGTIEEVRENIRRYGELDVCRLHPGFFAETLPKFRDRCVLVFLDVDLRESEETCLRYLWHLLQDDCYLFSHEAAHLDVAQLFYDPNWWRTTHDCEPPGLVGAGCGLGLVPATGAFRSALGYTVKNPRLSAYRTVPQVGRGEPEPSPSP